MWEASVSNTVTTDAIDKVLGTPGVRWVPEAINRRLYLKSLKSLRTEVEGTFRSLLLEERLTKA